MNISSPNSARGSGIVHIVLLFSIIFTFAFVAAAQTAPISGTVVMKKSDGTSVPVEGAMIEVGRVDVAVQYPASRTSRRGEFAFAGLPLGAVFWLTVSAPGANPEVIPNIKAGMENIQVTLSPGDGRRYTTSEIREMLKDPSEQKKYNESSVGSKINTDGFMGIKYGMSVAEARKVIAVRQIGKIEESKSYSDMLVISEGKTDYVFESDASRYKFLDDLDIKLLFVDDKFFQATIEYRMSETFYRELFLLSQGKKDPLSDDFENIKKDFDRIYYKTEVHRKSTVKENGLAIWEFKQPQGKSNFIALSQKDNNLFLTFQNTELFELAERRIKDSETAKTNFAAGEKYRSEKRYDLAVAEYTQTIRLDPDHEEAYHWRGHSYLALNKYELAVADFTSALKYEPESTHYLNDRAAAYANWSSTKYDLALADLNKAIKIKPNDARPYLLRARIFCAQGKKALAAADEKDAVSLGGTVTQKCEQ